jgi:hypothetical protein
MSIKDNEAVYDDQINPLMAQIIAICKEHEIPFLASFQYSEEGLCTSYVLPSGSSPRLNVAADLLYPGEPTVATFVVTKGNDSR